MKRLIRESKNELLKNIDATKFIDFLCMYTNVSNLNGLADLTGISISTLKSARRINKISENLYKTIVATLNVTVDDYNNFLNDPSSFSSLPRYEDYYIKEQLKSIDQKDFLDYVKYKTGLGNYQLAQSLGVYENTFSKVNHGHNGFSPEIIKKIRDVYKITIEQYLENGGEIKEEVENESYNTEQLKELINNVDQTSLIDYLKSTNSIGLEELSRSLGVSVDYLSSVYKLKSNLNVKLMRKITKKYDFNFVDYQNFVNSGYERPDYQGVDDSFDQIKFLEFVQVVTGKKLNEISMELGLNEFRLNKVNRGEANLTEKLKQNIIESYNININQFESYLLDPSGFENSLGYDDINLKNKIDSINSSEFLNYVFEQTGTNQIVLADSIGIYQSVLSDIVNGRIPISPTICIKIEETYGITIDKFIDFKNNVTSGLKKRLIKKAENIVLYHGTSLENLEKIVDSGFLKPRMLNGVGSSGLLYFGDIDEAKAHGYGASQQYYDEWDGGPPYAVMEVNVSSEDLLPDNDDCKECKTWEESMAVTYSCATNKDVSIDRVTKVILIGGPWWDTEIESTLDNWKETYNNNKDKLFVPGEE